MFLFNKEFTLIIRSKILLELSKTLLKEIIRNCRMRRDIVSLAIYFLLSVFLTGLVGCHESEHRDQATKQQPNFFIYLADDLSYGDLGITGNPYVSTPTIDAFAKEAISFSSMYTPTAMCAPSRSALLTGLYPHNNGCHMNHGSIKDGVSTLPSYLRELGYQVALVGKKHIQPLRLFPFDYVAYDSLDAYLSEVSQPVCVIYASNEPHGPHTYGIHDSTKVVIPHKWLDTPSTRKQLGGYYNDIKTMDEELKNYTSTIKKYKLDEHAVTIFTSDHGFEYFAKWSCYEAGLRVPFYLKANGINFKTSKVEQLTSFVDITPTLIELAGGKATDDLDGRSLVLLLQNQDTILHKYIYGAHTTRGIYSGYAYPIRSITDGKWKYIRNLNYKSQFQNILTNGWNFDATPTTGSWADWLSIKDSKSEGHHWATMYQHRPYDELYNLSKDPNELNNLAADTKLESTKSKLSKELDNWMLKQGDKGMASEMSVALKARDMSKVPKE